jgi:HK97 family phage portal protein
MLVPTVAGETVTTSRSAMGLADVFACVRALADAAAICPLLVYRSGDNGRERVESGPAADLLRSPAPGVTQSTFVSSLLATLALWGEGFVGLYRAEGEIVQLGLLDPSRVEVEIRGGEPRYTWTDPNGQRHPLTRSDVVHVRGLSLDGVRGASPVSLCREALGLSAALATHASATLANGAVPGGILSVPAGALGQEAIENAREAWEARHGGASQARRIAVLSGEVNWQPVSMPFADMEYVAQRKLSTVEVCRIFRVPPWMVAAEAGDSLTYATTEGQAAAFVKFGLAPWLVAIEQALTACDELFAPRSYAQFKLEGLLRPDSAGRAAFYTSALDEKTGWMTRAEVRELEDLPREEAA